MWIYIYIFFFYKNESHVTIWKYKVTKILFKWIKPNLKFAIRSKQPTTKYFIDLFKKVQGSLGVVAQQVVKNQTQAGQVEGHCFQLGVSALCHFCDGLGDQGQDWPPTTLWQVVEKEQQELKVLHIKVVFSVNRTLNSVLLQSSQKSMRAGKER